MQDFRLVKKTYAGPNDAMYICDTLYMGINLLRNDPSEEKLEKLADFQRLLEVKTVATVFDICKFTAEKIIAGTLTFRQIFAVARVLGCDTKPEDRNRHSEPQPELNPDKLLDHIKEFLASDWDKVVKGKKQPSSALEWTFAGDASSLEGHLEKVLAHKNNAEDAQSTCEGNMSTLRSELLEQYESRCALVLAVYFQSSECLRVLIQYAAKDGPETFKKVMECKNMSGDSPCTLAIECNVLDCIMEFARGGLNFFERNIYAHGRLTSAFALLVKRASKEATEFLENFKILVAELQKYPTFNVNMVITCGDHRSYRFRNIAERERLMQIMMGAEPQDLPPSFDYDYDSDEDLERLDDEFEDLINVDNATAMEGDAPAGVPADAGNAPAVIDAAELNLDGDAEDMEADGQESIADVPAEGDNVSRRSTTLLNIAASYSGVEVLKILLNLGAVPAGDVLHDAVRSIGSFIRTARYSSNVDMPSVAAGMACIEALLDAGVDVNAEQPVTKNTALHLAARKRCHEVLSLLLEKGANPGKRNKEGKTAAEIAEESQDPVAVDILTRFARLQRLSSFMRSASQNERRESQENSEVSEEMACVACLTEKKSVILAPCGHKVLCRGCTKRLLTRPEIDRKCPFCRSKLESFVVQVFE